MINTRIGDLKFCKYLVNRSVLFLIFVFLETRLPKNKIQKTTICFIRMRDFLSSSAKVLNLILSS